MHNELFLLFENLDIIYIDDEKDYIKCRCNKDIGDLFGRIDHRCVDPIIINDVSIKLIQCDSCKRLYIWRFKNRG